MKFFGFLVAVLSWFVVPFTAHGADWKWSRTDTAFQLAAITMTVIDWRQTAWTMNQYNHRQARAATSVRTIGSVPNSYPRYSEINPILGGHPSQGRINTYFVGFILGHTAIARILPCTYRRAWQVLVVVGEGVMVGRNFSIGARLQW